MESFTDVSWDVFGQQLNFERSYFSGSGTPAAASVVGSFGPGWVHTWQRQIVDKGQQGAVEFDGRANGMTFPPDGNGGYLRPSIGGATLQKGADGSWTITYTTGQVFHYLPNSFLDYVTDAAGNKFQLMYAADGSLKEIVDPAGKKLSLNVVGGRIQSVTRKDGITLHYTYSADGRLATYQDARGLTTSYNYDASTGDLTQIVYPTGDQTNFTYTNGQVTRIRAVTHLPDGAERASVSEIAYPSAQQRQFIDPLGGAWTMEFDPNGYEVKRTDPLGRIYTMVRDTAGRLTEYSEPDGAFHKWSYTPGGQIAIESLPLGETTTCVRDPITGWLTGYIHPDGNNTSYVLDATGNLLRTTDTLHRTTLFERNSQGLVTKTIDPLGRQSFYTYDGDGLLATEVDATGGTTSYQRDAMGRVVRIQTPGGRTAQFEYCDCGALTASTDGLGKRTSYGIDNLGRRISVTEPVRDRPIVDHRDRIRWASEDRVYGATRTASVGPRGSHKRDHPGPHIWGHPDRI